MNERSIPLLAIIIILFVPCVTLYLLGTKADKVPEYKDENIGFRVWCAMIIDIFVALILLCFTMLLYVRVSKSPPFIAFFVVLYLVLLFSGNVFYTSVGFKIAKIVCPRYHLEIAVNAAFYIFCILVLVDSDNMVLKALAGLYGGIDSFTIMVKRVPFIYFVCKISIFKVGSNAGTVAKR
jgi:hypothetical protein